MEWSHSLSCSCSGSAGGDRAGSPHLPQIYRVLLSPCLPGEIKLHRPIHLFIASWPRDVSERQRLNFSASVNQCGASFDIRKGVSIFLWYLCTENTVSVIICPHIPRVPERLWSTAEDFPCFPCHVVMLGWSWCLKHFDFS